MTVVTQKLTAVSGQSADLVITFDFSPIDGPGGILGQAGPTRLRAGSLLPFQGQMQFDSADITSQSLADLDALFLHEMGHVLGIGTLWQQKKCETCNPGSAGNNANYNPNGVCPAASNEFVKTPGRNTGVNLQVELNGGAGTACGHWSEDQLQSELMTGFLTLNPVTGISELSRITIAALTDLGYTCNFAVADPFTIPSGPNNAVVRAINNDTPTWSVTIVETEATSWTPIADNERTSAIAGGVVGGLVVAGVVSIGAAVYIRKRRQRNVQNLLAEDRHVALTAAV